jgi:hypothetical protein
MENKEVTAEMLAKLRKTDLQSMLKAMDVPFNKSKSKDYLVAKLMLKHAAPDQAEDMRRHFFIVKEAQKAEKEKKEEAKKDKQTEFGVPNLSTVTARDSTVPPVTFVIVWHDESCFHSNDGKHRAWMEEHRESLLPKSAGTGLMSSDMICLELGYLQYNVSVTTKPIRSLTRACVRTKYGRE